MTMDIQKLGRGEQSTPDLKVPVEDAKGDYQKDQQYTACSQRSVKRSFDVAFLMMPDEKMKQKQVEKQLRISKQLFAENHYASLKSEVDNFRKNHEYLNKSSYAEELKGTDLTYRQNNNVSPSNQELNIDVGTDEFATKSVLSDSDVSDMSRSRPDSTESFSRPARIVHESPYRNKVFDDPSLISQARANYEQHEKFISSRFSEMAPRSAFTKVTNNYQSPTTTQSAASPGHSESPDNLSYQNSMSPPLTTSSPPMLNNLFSKSPQFKSLIPPNHPFLSSSHAFFKSQNLQTYQNHFSDPSSNVNSEPTHFSKSSPPNYPPPEKSEPPPSSNKFGHLLPFRPEISPYLQTNASPYSFPIQNFHHPGAAEFLKFPQQNESINPLMRNPAAAILSTLLPPTLASLSLPTQNICAKCNISFRMTSDLVYHMRSHHKSEVNYDTNRRKREDKLKCPVCAESFRERHHLTRHMTAHQDKEGDILDQQLDSTEGNSSSYCSSKTKNRPYYGHSNGLHQK